MGAKLCHNEALGTILTPGVPKTAQDSKKGRKRDLIDPPPGANLGAKTGEKNDLETCFVVFLTFVFETRFFIDFGLHLALILRGPTLVPIERARSDCMLAVFVKK